MTWAEAYDPTNEKRCVRCKEMWPPDEEFYRPGKNQCRACEYEVKNASPSRDKAYRKVESQRSRDKRAEE